MAGYLGSRPVVVQVDGYQRTEAESRYVNVSGDDFTGHLDFTDDAKARFGSSDEMHIYTESSGSGYSYIQGDNIVIRKADQSTNYLTALGGVVTLCQTTFSGDITLSSASNPEIKIAPSDATPAFFKGDSNRSSAGQHLTEFQGYWNGTQVARIVVAAGDDTTNKDDGHLDFFTTPSGGSSTRAIRIKSDGNIGVGTTTIPAANSAYLTVGTQNYAISHNGFSKNSYFDGSSYKAITNDAGKLIQMGDDIIFYHSPTVSAGASQTQETLMKLEGDGDVLIPDGVVTVGTSSKTTDTDIKLSNDNKTFGIRADRAGSYFSVVDFSAGQNRLVIDSSGNFLVAKNTSDGATTGFEARATGQVMATIASATNEAVMYITQTGGGGNNGVDQGLVVKTQGTNAVSGTGNVLRCAANNATHGTFDNILSVKNNGRVGIGEGNPDRLLHLTASATPILRFTGNGSDQANYAYAEIEFENADDSASAFTVDASIVVRSSESNGNGGQLCFNTGVEGNSERLRIASDGVVGIGTHAGDQTAIIGGVHILDHSFSNWTHSGIFKTQCALRVETYWKGNNDHARAAGDYGGGIGFNHLAGHSSGHGDNLHAWIGLNVYDTPGHERSSLVFATNDAWSGEANHDAGCTERMRITPAGDVLIKTTNTFDTQDNSNGSTSRFGYINSILHLEGNANPPLRLKRNSGDGAIVAFNRGGQTGVGSISVTTSATAFNTSSDYRLKENVSYDWDATSRLKQLKPARFNFKVDKDTTVDGFLAHEVSSIVPEAITGTKDEVDEDGNPVMQGIDQSKLVPLLVKTIQEQQTVIELLTARIEALEA